MLLAYVAQWKQRHPVWTWHYAQDDLQPGDWVLDLVSPTGQTDSFFLHPVGTLLHLVSPVPLTRPA